jgi:hypothetical protein
MTGMSRFSRRTLLLLVLGGVLVSCNAVSWMNEPGASGAVAVGKPAPDAAGEDAEGHALSLVDYRGRVVVLSFWAST